MEPKHNLIIVMDPQGKRYLVDGQEVSEAEYLAAEKENANLA